MHLRNSSFSEKNETRLKNVYLKEIWFIWFPSLILHLVLVLAFTMKYNRLIYQWYFKVLLHTGKFYTCILYICFLLLAGLFNLDRMRHWARHLKSRANDYDYEFPLLSILSHISPFSHTRMTLGLVVDGLHSLCAKSEDCPRYCRCQEAFCLIHQVFNFKMNSWICDGQVTVSGRARTRLAASLCL